MRTRWRVHTQTWAELAKQIVIGDMKVPIALSELPIYTQMCVLRLIRQRRAGTRCP
jgi:hypothetical protein